VEASLAVGAVVDNIQVYRGDDQGDLNNSELI
jgi:hypothetical protein